MHKFWFFLLCFISILDICYAQSTSHPNSSQLHLVQATSDSYFIKQNGYATHKSNDLPAQISLSIEKAKNSQKVNLLRQELFDSSLKLYTASKDITDIVSLPINYLYMNEDKSESILLTQLDHMMELVLSEHNNSKQFIQISEHQLQLKPNKVEGLPPVDYTCSTEDPISPSMSYTEYKTYKSHNQEQAILDLYIEIDHALYLKLNEDLGETLIWVAQVFSQIELLYGMHNIHINITGIKIWDQADPYATTYSNRDILPQFGASLQDDFEGQAGLFLSGKVGGGGLAWVDKLCAAYKPTNHSGPYGVNSYLSTTVASGLTDNYTARVIAHELGHIIGSHHTHKCVWGPNNDEAYDGCYSASGNCNRGPLPEDGGTIMSYCYLDRDIGVNFNHGFGDEPGALLYAKVMQANCRTCVPGESCDDEDSCTTDDVVDDDCVCRGILKDANHNNVCDDDEPCPDVNLNDICDMDEDCLDHINLDTISVMDQFVMAKKSIKGSQQMSSSNNLVLNAGDAVELLPGFQVQINTSLEIVTTGCNNSN